MTHRLGDLQSLCSDLCQMCECPASSKESMRTENEFEPVWFGITAILDAHSVIDSVKVHFARFNLPTDLSIHTLQRRVITRVLRCFVAYQFHDSMHHTGFQNQFGYGWCRDFSMIVDFELILDLSCCVTCSS